MNTSNNWRFKENGTANPDIVLTCGANSVDDSVQILIQQLESGIFGNVFIKGIEQQGDVITELIIGTTESNIDAVTERRVALMNDFPDLGLTKSAKQEDLNKAIVDLVKNVALSAGAGLYENGITPTSQVPDLESKVFTVTIPGTYTNFGNVVLPENNFGFIFKNGNSFSLQSVEMPMQDLAPLENKIDSVVTLGNNLIDTKGKFRAGSYISTGAFVASINWLSLLPIVVDGTNFKEGDFISVNGLGGVGTTSVRIVFMNKQNQVISYLNGKGTAPNTPKYLTSQIPTGCGAILLNVAGTPGAGSDPENSPFHNSLIISKGQEVLPFEKYGYVKKELAKLIYISPNGNDNNRGLTELNPIKTFARAKQLLSDEGQLIFLDGDYFDFDIDFSAFRNIRGKEGTKVRLIYGTRISTANIVSGKTKTYSYPYNHNGTWLQNYYLWQHDILDETTEILIQKRHVVHNGRSHRLPHKKLKWVNSIDEVENSAIPCYYYDSTNKIMYFQKVSGSDLTSNPIVIPNVNSLRSSSPKNVNHDNIIILYKPFRTKNLFGKIFGFEVLCVNATGAIITDDSINLDLYYCRAGGSSNDGFNGHFTGTATNKFNQYLNVQLIDCWAHDCYDDAESHHNYCQIQVDGGLFEYSGSGCTPASGAHATYKNVTVQNNEFSGFQAQGESLDGGIGTQIQCWNCVGDENGKNFEGRGLDSRFINSVSIKPKTTHFSGTSQKINCVEIN